MGVRGAFVPSAGGPKSRSRKPCEGSGQGFSLCRASVTAAFPRVVEAQVSYLERACFPQRGLTQLPATPLCQCTRVRPHGWAGLKAPEIEDEHAYGAGPAGPSSLWCSNWVQVSKTKDLAFVLEPCFVCSNLQATPVGCQVSGLRSRIRQGHPGALAGFCSESLVGERRWPPCLGGKRVCLYC